ncbi:(d)CMP kinase [Anaerosalibacter sp. Marseille-P3206]|uniref:(d)CMP kinase n=1 Tax=Anaerosalibacter sp. Marseille-P3206 TaxID=1871005 RepID=UPI000BE88BA9|nr:(d)CMP kinase [Anaerosalibacter sp. Marseille-P3206]
MDRIISIAIDGPAGSGKSTISKLISQKLNIEYIDTGAMYRAFTLKILNKKISLDDSEKILSEINNTIIDFKDNHIYLDGEIVDKQIRENIINQNVSYIAKIKEVRYRMVELQREIAKNKSVIMDGRDIGTVVLPDATYKFFIIASVDERAKRRYKELANEGEINITLEQVKKELKMRDKIDSTRDVAPLVKAKDAIEVDTTEKNIEESVNTILEIIQGR